VNEQFPEEVNDCLGEIIPIYGLTRYRKTSPDIAREIGLYPDPTFKERRQVGGILV